MPDAEALPVPDDEYFEIECAKTHGGWTAWERLPAWRRGRLLAHELEKNMRDHYYYDQRDKKGVAPGNPPPAKDVSALIREKWQGRGVNIADKI